ncbi:MAG: hypothetical protein IK100_05345 [Muribaculaceae bacterium]|nr:hypothetical protein [Muribaculaceae bacterium]MBR5118053.1 hypothetical protein [Muribaculaceae bacterium]
MSNKVDIPSSVPASQVVIVPDNNWKGLTLEELQRRRAKWLVKREVSRMTLAHKYESTRENVSQNGVRALLFNSGEVSMLKKTDYFYLGFKAINALVKLYIKRKRR